jgi:WD40-like Beta Propeller Repeat
MRITPVLVALPILAFGGTHGRPQGPHYAPVYPLNPREGVFAYARISPDGRRLVYASQMSARVASGSQQWTETAVDLAMKRVLFSAPGIDAYWSVDGTRLIYSGEEGVTVRNMESGEAVVSSSANGLGDYYSWALRGGKDLILTIESNYYYLDGNKAVLPPSKVKLCDGIGTGDRPLISKDGTRITTFVRGNVVVRGLDNCDDIFDTGIQGAKADFSWDGRYIAFHALKEDGAGYEIRVVDVQQRTVRTLPGLGGSALFPSWTQDGRLCFRYDGPDYRGFMVASGVLSIPAEPLPAVPEKLPDQRTWGDIFPGTPAPAHGARLVLIWAPWSVHSRDAFDDLEKARAYFATRMPELSIVEAADPGSPERDIASQLAEFQVTVPRVPLSRKGLLLTEGRNQMPTTLLFRDGVLIDRRLGAQSFERLRDWVESAVPMRKGPAE